MTIPDSVTKRQLSISFKPKRVTVQIEGETRVFGDTEHELDSVRPVRLARVKGCAAGADLRLARSRTRVLVARELRAVYARRRGRR
jgi:hypothetical protein